uniref:F-box/FBD/LRR-repeat protein At1g13570-like n=1 Tax=Erigeron canadensis TaxID=72917 RepID=UPI001CB9610A|nr:F-box/FBD/LRR-repeat protein At1g13570-like [Erigeron canadensis]
MEVVHRRKASKVSPKVEEDVISTMPEDVIVNIMERLPLKDAVGTSILSTSWRFKWTLLTRLIFEYEFFSSLGKRKIHFDKTNISRFLLHLKGPITKFALSYTDHDIKVDVEDIHHWVMLLSRIRGLMELTLMYWNSKRAVKLPTHLFSCLDLKLLYLRNFVLPPLPYVRGFPKLLSLDLHNVSIQDHRCGELIAQSPLLETLNILNKKLRGEVKLVEIAKLKNVKKLSLSLCLLDNMTMVRLSYVLQHFSLLPRLQELYLCFYECKFLPEDGTQNPVSNTFPFLKTLTLRHIDFSSNSMLSCAFGMLFGCVNLQTLDITPIYKNVVPLPAIFSPEVDCSTMGRLQLRNVKLAHIRCLENELCLIKYVLACSSMLKNIVINSCLDIDDVNEKNELSSKLLKLHRASPIAEIILTYTRVFWTT